MSSSHPLPARPSAITQAQSARLAPYSSTPVSPFRANSPKTAISTDSNLSERPGTATIDATALRVDNHLIQFGQEWEIHYRKWDAITPLHAEQWQHEIKPSTNSNSSNSTKRSRTTAFDPTTSNSPSTASTSSNPTRSSSKLDQVTNSNELDPIEVAKRTILATTKVLGAELKLFSHIDIQEDLKGKGKESETISRGLWVFAVIRRDDIEMEEEKAVDKVLAGFEFTDLKQDSAGHFSYRDLIPALPIDSTVDSSSPPQFLSALTLSETITSTLLPIYQAFLSAVQQSLILVLAKPNSTVQLADSIVFLPPSTTLFGSPGPRELPQAIRLSFTLMLQQSGLLLQPIISDQLLKRFPSSTSTVLTKSPILLAPFGLEATYLRDYEVLSKRDGKVRSKREKELEIRLRAAWNQILEGSGTSLAEEEDWIICNLEEEGSVELIWPASLCVLDGTRPQPQRSPERPDPPDLVPLATALPLNIDNFRNGRRRLAQDTRRSHDLVNLQESLEQHGERISLMIIETVKSKERKSVLEAELASSKAITTPSNPIVVVPPPSTSHHSNGPVQLKTPVSLGGPIDIPSPIDNFNDRLAIPIVDTPQAPDLSEVYPSPPNKIEEKPIQEKEVVDSFADLDWGDEFGGGGGGNLPGEFDDGMMMGLTDDDFSFFDDPRPILAAPASTNPSPNFVDHFSHLSNTPFNGLTTSPSPFRPSPQIGSTQQLNSPGMGGLLPFGFDTPGMSSGNSLGLGVNRILEVPDYSPKIEYSTIASQSSSMSKDRFGAISFGGNHSVGDCKYESRKGKFGLPTPKDEDSEETKMMMDLNRLERSKDQWNTSIYDPRIGKANRLRVKRRPTVSGEKEKRKENVRWKDEKKNLEEESESEESMDEEISPLEFSDLHNTSDRPEPIPLPYGPSILLLRHRIDLIRPPRLVQPRKLGTTAVATHNRELIASTLIDQIIHNPDYRHRFETSFAFESVSKTVSAHAIKSSNQSLSNAISSSLSPLVKQSDPLILLRQQQATLETSLAALNFWKPMSFEPLSGPKAVTAFVVFEDGGPQMRVMVKDWLAKIGESYQNLRLGTHNPGAVGTFVEGMMQVASGSFQLTSNTFLKHIYGNIEQASRINKRIVVYILDPSGKLPCTTASPITIAVRNLSKIDCNGTASVAIFPIPTSSLFEGSTLVPSLNRLAFAVYDRLLIAIPKLISHSAEPFPKLAPIPMARFFRMFQSPSFTLSISKPKLLEFHLKWPIPTLAIEVRHRFLQFGFITIPSGFDEGLEWVLITAIDETGENWRSLSKLLPSIGKDRELLRARAIWGMARLFAEEAEVEWRIVIASIEGMSLVELKAWDVVWEEEISKWNRPASVSIISLELEPAISILHVETDSVEELEPILLKPHLDTQPTLYSYTPTELIILKENLVVPNSTYLIHLPRNTSLARTSPTTPIPSAISILGIHLLAFYCTKSSTLTIPATQQLLEISENLGGLSGLGRERNGRGRLPIHVGWLGGLRTAFEGI